MPKAFVVANPRSGSANIDQLRGALARRLIDPWSYELYLLEEGRDVGPVIQEHVAAGVDAVVAAGGDGTVRVVAANLVGTGVELGILPEGTANVLAHDTGLPSRLEDALGLIAGEHATLALDAIQVGDAYAFLNLSIGLSAGIIRDTASEDKQRFGMLAYVWAGARNLFAAGVKDIDLTLDGEEMRLRATEVLVANCPSMGLPDLRASTSIHPADGVLQVVAFRARDVRDYLHVAWELLLGRRRTRRHIQVLDVHDEVTITCREPLDVQADGDLIGCTPVTARVISGAVQLIVPRTQRAAGGGSQVL